MIRTDNLKKSSAVLLVCGIAVAGLLLHRLAGFLIRKLPIETYWYQRLLIQTVSALLSCGWLFLFRKQFVLREKGRTFRTYCIPVILAFLYCGVVICRQTFGYGGTLRPVPELIAFALTMLLVGVSEELLHRGVILNILTAAFGTDTFPGAVLCCFIGGTLFGLIHLFNLFSGIAPSAVIVQTIGAAGAGWLFCALYLRSRNIYWVIVLHALNDFGSMSRQGLFTGNGTVENAIENELLTPGASLLTIVISAWSTVILFGALTLLLLRKEKMQYPDAETERRMAE